MQEEIFDLISISFSASIELECVTDSRQIIIFIFYNFIKIH